MKTQSSSLKRERRSQLPAESLDLFLENFRKKVSRQSLHEHQKSYNIYKTIMAIKKNDNVIILTGKDKGKTGKVDQGSS
jgi:hypothetical protein